MATTLFPITTASTRTSSSFVTQPTWKQLSLSRGSGSTTQTDATKASLTVVPIAFGSTNNWSIPGIGGGASLSFPNSGGVPSVLSTCLGFISEPIAAVTISGTITANMRALESSMNANYACQAVIYRIASGNGALSSFATSGLGTEIGTAEAASNFTITPTATNFLNGDMIGVFFGFGSATATASASGFTASFFYAGASGATGDSFVTFTETIVAAVPFKNPAMNFADPTFV